MRLFWHIFRDILLLFLCAWAIYTTTHQEEIVATMVDNYLSTHDIEEQGLSLND